MQQDIRGPSMSRLGLLAILLMKSAQVDATMGKCQQGVTRLPGHAVLRLRQHGADILITGALTLSIGATHRSVQLVDLLPPPLAPNPNARPRSADPGPALDAIPVRIMFDALHGSWIRPAIIRNHRTGLATSCISYTVTFKQS